MTTTQNNGDTVWFETKTAIRQRLVRDYGFHPDDIVMATYPPDPHQSLSDAFSEFWATELEWRKKICEGLMIPPEYMK
jgi:hypothetical protein